MTTIENPLTENIRLLTKLALLEGKDVDCNFDGTPCEFDYKKKSLDIVLDNILNYIETKEKIDNDVTLAKIILPIVRRVLPNTIINELAGVQALSAPSGDIKTIRICKNEDQKISVKLLELPVETVEEPIQMRWTFDPARGERVQKGIDIEAEIMAAAAREITAEYDCSFLTTMRNIATPQTSIFDMEEISGPNVGDMLATLAIMIQREANLIAMRTRRGVGNRAVVSPTALTILRAAEGSGFVYFENPYLIENSYVGKLNNSINVYCDHYALDNTPVMVSYKGNMRNDDAPIIWSPYMPMKSTGIFINPNNTNDVSVSFAHQNSMHVLQNTLETMGNASDYIGLIGIEPTTLSFL